ncbi:MAG TPA: TIGR04222 domain-containing membrane protein [Pseudonocardiaceae bacterium]|nr:TIGR04222 domain-containing membrane protein [Pseudonocardiaceae bacterium]
MGWSQYALGAGAIAAVVLAAVVRFFPRRGEPAEVEPGPTMLGYLVGGTARAVVTALAVLHVRGAVRAARTGTVRQAEENFDDTDPLLSATYAAIEEPNGPHGIEAAPELDRAVAEVRKELIAARFWVPTGRWVTSQILFGLLVVLVATQVAASRDALSIAIVAVAVVLSAAFNSLDRRTRAARVLVARLRREHPVSNVGSDADSIGYTVAAHGRSALLAVMPSFAQDGGLLDGGLAVQFIVGGPESSGV